ncbi:glycosyltransferase [Methylopila sp. M107]|uniref:glycosyltransferase n=1 Tax=Methylopila sp. M107 TaxID=1101190 RepID=UPI0003A86338|nr:glycosyltransferase [Methylopila sp. M107]
MKLIGITRFSIVTTPSLATFKATKGRSLHDAKAISFAPAILDKRLRFFRHFCCPTYRMMAETDAGSFGLVLINADLPDPYRGEIRALCAATPRLQLIEMSGADSVAGVTTQRVREMAAGEKLFTYRFDDDDALSKDYTVNVRRICAELPTNSVVSFNTGYRLCRAGKDEFGVHIKQYPLNAYGLGVISDASDLRTIFQLGSHKKIDLPTHHDQGAISWISTVHDINDSRVAYNKPAKISGAEVIARTSGLFPQITLEAIRSLPEHRASGDAA